MDKADEPESDEDEKSTDADDDLDKEGEEEYGDKFWDNLDENDRAGWEDNMNKD